MSWMVKNHTLRNGQPQGVARDEFPGAFTHDVSRLSQLTFLRVFTEDLSRLYQLSFLLTRDHEKAVRCFIAALEDCIQGNSAFSVGARSYAKRAVIEQAVLELRNLRDGGLIQQAGGPLAGRDLFEKGERHE